MYILNETSEKYSKLDQLDIDLFPHQRTLIYACSKREQNGYFVNNGRCTESIVGIIADKVGSGKTLVMAVLSAFVKLPPTHNVPLNGKYMIVTKYKPPSSNGKTCIIVPHSLIHHWKNTLKSINAEFITLSVRRNLESHEEIDSAPIILISATLVKHLVDTSHWLVHDYWSRIIIDEADTIKLTPSYHMRGNFIWLVTATPQRWITNHSAPGQFMRNNRQLLPDIMILNEPSFVEASLQLPPIKHHHIDCLTPFHVRLVSGHISNNLMEMLHAGNSKQVIEYLGCKQETPNNVVEALTENFKAQLYDKQQRLEYKQKLRIGSHIEEIKTLTEEITSLKTKIKQIEERIIQVKEQVCPICFDEPIDMTVTPCCHQVFCLSCLCQVVQRKQPCPCCRAPLDPANLTTVNTHEPVTKPSKTQAAINIILNNPKGRFNFSNYDSSFNTMTDQLTSKQIKYSFAMGSADHVARIMERFETGEINVILLNAMYYGAGLNLQKASDVILFHRLSPASETQVIGRAHRPGRQEALEVHHLLHFGE